MWRPSCGSRGYPVERMADVGLIAMAEGLEVVDGRRAKLFIICTPDPQLLLEVEFGPSGPAIGSVGRVQIGDVGDTAAEFAQGGLPGRRRLAIGDGLGSAQRFADALFSDTRLIVETSDSPGSAGIWDLDGFGAALAEIRRACGAEPAV